MQYAKLQYLWKNATRHLCTMNLTFVTSLSSIDNYLFVHLYFLWTKPGNVTVSEVYKLQELSQSLKLLLLCNGVLLYSSHSYKV